VKPLYKEECDTDIRIYRPVSLIPAFSKVIEKIMHKRLLSFLSNCNVSSNKQHGFCKGKATNTAITRFIARVYKSLDDRKISIGLFLDLSQACDLVDHHILLRKMTLLGPKLQPLM
jgi:hypothetical protein